MNNFIIISAPSGSGKTTICKYLQKLDSSINFSVSCTTRQKRVSEVEGKDYFFITNEEFEKKINDARFIEWEQIHGNFYYGTLKSTLEKAINEDKRILLELDVKGAMSVKKLYPNKSLSIFIEPPSVEVLKLLNSKSDDERITLSKEISSITLVFLFFHSGPPKSDIIDISSSLSEAKKNFQLSSILFGSCENLK